jgi:uncharacterized protein YcsI (UPF0317 family)
MEFAKLPPRDLRALIREGKITKHTSGMCEGYAQANLAVLPSEYAYDFLLFAQRNPKSCPVLEVADRGSRFLKTIAPGADIAKDIPKYRVYQNGVLEGEYTDVSGLWRDDFVSFLIGCSFSFESELIASDIPVRHIEEGRNVPMYITGIDCEPAGIFHGKMVVSMRPIAPNLVVKAVQVTASMPRVHGAPVHIGDPELIGIKDLGKPDFGDDVTIKPGEVPVFWACGVTPQSVIMSAKPSMAITHAPGHMLVTDVKNLLLKY